MATDMTDPLPPQAPPRRLRRRREGRVAAGVAGGLGDYFAVDPVLFRVLFATSAFFGGAGILAYLLAWAVVPDEGTEDAAIDRWISELRRRRIPLWIVVAVAGVVLWALAFSWWVPGPGPAVPIVAIVIALLYARRGSHREPPAGSPPPAPTPPGSPEGSPTGSPVNLTKSTPAPEPAAATSPAWVGELRNWHAESRAAARRRRRRAMPLRVTALVALVLTLVALGLADAVAGIPFVTYFWSALGITGAALLLGLVLRRTPWSLTPLLVVAALGTLAFGGSHASLHDGTGRQTWRPTFAPQQQYRLMFGRATLDLRALPPQATPRTVRVTVGAGEVRVLSSRSVPVAVTANVHIGTVTVHLPYAGSADGGMGITRDVPPASGATGAPVRVIVHLADGRVDVVRR